MYRLSKLNVACPTHCSRSLRFATARELFSHLAYCSRYSNSWWYGYGSVIECNGVCIGTLSDYDEIEGTPSVRKLVAIHTN